MDSEVERGILVVVVRWGMVLLRWMELKDGW